MSTELSTEALLLVACAGYKRAADKLSVALVDLIDRLDNGGAFNTDDYRLVLQAVRDDMQEIP
jgi:hypothetical protein